MVVSGVLVENRKRGDMKANELEKLDDGELAELIDQAQQILIDRKERRKQEAIEAARSALAGVGLSFRDVANPKVQRVARTSGGAVLAAGKRYVNPADPKQVWTSGRGRRPTWVKELERKGQLPDPH